MVELPEAVPAYFDAFNRRDWDAARRWLHPEVEWMDVPELPDSETMLGPDRVVDGWRRLAEPMPDLAMEILEAERGPEDVLLLTIGVGGTGSESGAAVQARFWHLAEVRDGLLVRARNYFDEATARRVAGLTG